MLLSVLAPLSEGSAMVGINDDLDCSAGPYRGGFIIIYGEFALWLPNSSRAVIAYSLQVKDSDALQSSSKLSFSREERVQNILYDFSLQWLFFKTASCHELLVILLLSE